MAEGQTGDSAGGGGGGVGGYRLDFTYESNNFGVGLPPKGKNGEKWKM